jgi:Protein of unknown function (DUF3305)
LSAAVPLLRIPVGVLVERRKAANPWIDYVWTSTAVLAGAPEAAPWTPVAHGAEATTFYAGAAEVALFRTETGNYRDNLSSGAPKLWVVLRPTGREMAYELLAVTADPAEGEAFTEAGNDLVEAVSMPEAIEATLAAFVSEHHVERPVVKRKRDRASPERHARTRRDDEEK